MFGTSVETGFSKEIFVQQPVKDVFICALCLGVLNNPHWCKMGHMFCLGCIKSSLAKNQNKCSSKCGASLELNVIGFALPIKNEIDNLEVSCACGSVDCKWTGKLHERLTRECQFDMQGCSNKGCKQLVTRKSLKHHTTKECPKRLETCSRCKDRGIRHDQMTDHVRYCLSIDVIAALKRLSPSTVVFSKLGEPVAKRQRCLNDPQNTSADVTASDSVDLSAYPEVTFPSGTYRGPISSDGKRNGWGSMHYAKGKHKGDIYIGGWVNGLKNGCECHLRSANGDEYQGEFEGDKPHGLGEMKYINGDAYHGVWWKGVHSGHGTMRYANGEFYEGMWYEGRREGDHGQMSYVGGDQYLGAWKKGERHGEDGTLNCASGDQYYGTWKQDVFVSGTIRFANGTKVRTGETGRT